MDDNVNKSTRSSLYVNVRRTEDGQVIVDKSRKFQRELGQWEESDSYILL